MSSPWIVRRPSEKDAPRRLYAFAHAGGSGTAYLPWQKALSANIEVRAVQLPGRGMRLAEPAFTSMRDLSREIARAIARDIELAPAEFALIGHSLGGLLAFEVVHELRRLQTRAPVRLFAMGSIAPRRRRMRQPLHALDDAAFIEALSHYQGTPPALLHNPELMELTLPALRADFKVVFDYRRPDHGMLDVPVVTLGATDDPIASPDDVSAWAEETTAGCSSHWFDGGHFFVHGPQASQVIAAVDAQMQDPPCV
ncbi:MAG: thioesterase [Burkholderiales bacterium]|jgi:surfactin synthase thioesterase subunit|nr:thioesterase [Burkholderiales bacterium]